MKAMKTRYNIYSIVTPCDAQFLETIRDFVGKIAQKYRFLEEDIQRIQISVDEACSNVIKHAYKGIVKRNIRVELQYANENMIISVIDNGKGFNPENLQEPDMNEYLKKHQKGGLGIHLIRSLMDDVSFSIKPFRKNKITMTIKNQVKERPCFLTMCA